MGCYKQPPTYLLPGTLAIIAFILCLFGSTWCKFISFTELNNTTDPVTLSYGIWNYLGVSSRQTLSGETVYMESCNYYPDNSVSVDTKWRSARAFSALTVIIGGLVTFWVVLSWCIRSFRGDRAKSLLRCAAMMYMLCCLFQGLTLLLMTSNACYNNGMVGITATTLKNSVVNFSGEFPTTCAMAGGGKATIAAVVMWFLAALAALKVEPPQPDPIMVESHNVTYTKNQQADGTQVVTETVVKGTPVPVNAANNNNETTVQEGAPADQAV